MTRKKTFKNFLVLIQIFFSKMWITPKILLIKILRHLINDQHICIISADKESCVVILNRTDYNNKVETMINKGIKSGRYVECQDTTLSDLKLFQEFLWWNFKNYENYDKMRPVVNQPIKLFGTTKTNKIHNAKDIDVEKLKFRPIIDQTVTFTHNFVKVIAKYLKPLQQYEYSIKDTQCFLGMLQDLLPLNNK